MRWVAWERTAQRTQRRRWGICSTVVLLTLALLVALCHWQPHASVSPPAAPAAMTVEWLPVVSAPAPSVVADVPRQSPRPLPEAPPALARILLVSPIAEVMLPVDMPAAVASEVVPQDIGIAAALAQQPMTVTQSDTGGEQVKSAQEAGAPAHNEPSLTGNASRITFEQVLLGHLQRHKRYPRMARLRREEGVPYVRFIMNRAGSVLSVQLERGSGHALLDGEALALLVRAEPLPAIPGDILDERLELVVPIEFFLRSS